MKKLVFIHALSLLILTACGGFKETDRQTQYIQGPTVYVPTPAPAVELTDVQKLVQDENNYRLGLGQTMLSSGLSCALYTIAGGDRIQSSIVGHNTLTGVTQVVTFLYKDAAFDQPNSSVNEHLNVLPEAIRAQYTNLYLLRCTGQLVVTTTGYYNFDLISDDGSLLYLDGSKLIDNDNNHGATLVSGQKYLRRGVHSFKLDFAQSGGGAQQLTLKANGSLIDSTFLYH